MTNGSRITIGRGVAALLALALVGGGALATYFVLRRTDASQTKTPSAGTTGAPATTDSGKASAPAASTPASAPSALPDVSVTLSAEAVKRAGIVVAPATAGLAAVRLRIPSIIEPNAYRQVIVTPLVGGRVTRVLAELGDNVRRGQAMAEIYSPELAEAQTQYLSFAAELEAAHQQLTRTERLVAIGAASRQELERVRAEHTAHATHVGSSRSRLVLLGVPPEQIARLKDDHQVSATMTVPAPLTGLVTERSANTGLNVDPATRLFTVVDLSTVWVVGDVHERDLARVRTGSPVAIVAAAYPDVPLKGRIDYIDPQVSSETRTARVRAQIDNAGRRLRLAMYAEMIVENGTRTESAVVPKAAVQTVAGNQVVYVSDGGEPGRFTQRIVQIGSANGQSVEIVSGLRPGEHVATEGSFHVRAEIERLGLHRPAAARTPEARPQATGSDVQTARVTVTEKGFEPATIRLRAGRRARITFVRTTDQTCATAVTLPALKLERALPLNQDVVIEFTPDTAGELTFACGMNMLRGVMVVQ